MHLIKDLCAAIANIRYECFLFCRLLLLLCITAAIVRSAETSDIPSIASGNISANGIVSAVDPHFSAYVQIRDRPLLPAESCYINTIMALVAMAQNDLFGNITGSHFSYPPFTDIVHSVTGLSVTAEESIPRRFAIWGFFQGTREHQNIIGAKLICECIAITVMAKFDKFAEALVMMVFEDRPVGYAFYKKPTIDGRVKNSSMLQIHDIPASITQKKTQAMRSDVKARQQPTVSELQNPKSLNFTRVGDSAVANDASNDPRLKIDVEFHDPEVAMANAYIGIIGITEEIAHFEPKARVIPFALTPVFFDVYIKVSEFGHMKRRSPPYLNYDMVAKSLGRLARLILREKNFESV